TYTNPDAARQLLAFRYRTLPEARLHAKNNYFQGAMYGWQVSELGIEQTPQGVGAYYSIHVVADIAYAILEYWNASHDEAFMLESGAEILIETARFWASRVHQNPKSGQYDILAVRGPNEYDVIVNNNLYTNMMAQQNLMFAAELIALLKRDYPAQWSQLSNKLQFAESELSQWAKICDKLVLAYDAERALYEEDDMYFCRVPLELVKMKTSRKRIIDTTLPYEALMLYQVSKQADVLHVMKNLHWRFTQQQKKNAWEYYLPKTCFDSSLGYCMHAVMAAQIGLREEAYRYYSVCANFDARNMQLNTISGLHFANFGGTWQAVIFGFAGVQVSEQGITVTPCLPEQWRSLEFSLCYGGGQLRLTLTHTELAVTLVHRAAQDVLLSAAGQCVVLNAKQSFYRFLLPSNNER
ncbi:MAG: glycosyl hydrolase family 65 protein, partial [Ruthenibacterium sp.]